MIRVDATNDAPDANLGNGVADDHEGNATLRAAIMEANSLAGENTIRIPPGTYKLSIGGQNEDAAATGDLDITGDLVIRGAGADKTFLDAASIDRVLHVLSGVKVILYDVTVTGGSADLGGGILNQGDLILVACAVTSNVASATGGGVHRRQSSVFSVERSTVAGNAAQAGGGGLYNDGSATIVNSTFSGNSTAASGGGLANDVHGTTELIHVTIATNQATVSGGGLDNAGTASSQNTIVATNNAPSAADVNGAVNSLGYNLIADISGSSGWLASDLQNINPLLGPLQDNGGTTFTHALLSGSPAIDAGDNEAHP